MLMSAFDFTPLLAANLPPPAVKYNGFPKYNFVGAITTPRICRSMP
jgi:2-aminoadipate transaminase